MMDVLYSQCVYLELCLTLLSSFSSFHLFLQLICCCFCFQRKVLLGTNWEVRCRLEGHLHRFVSCKTTKFTISRFYSVGSDKPSRCKLFHHLRQDTRHKTHMTHKEVLRVRLLSMKAPGVQRSTLKIEDGEAHLE